MSMPQCGAASPQSAVKYYVGVCDGLGVNNSEAHQKHIALWLEFRCRRGSWTQTVIA